MSASLTEGNRRWKPAAFRIAGDQWRWGSIWGRWGIDHARGRRYVVYLIDGARLTEFDRLRCARRFCEEIDGLADWSRPGDDPALALKVHRAALRVSGSRPRLRVVHL